MDVARPHAVIVNDLDAEVLRVLATAGSPMNARQIWRIAGRGSEKGIRTAAQRLDRLGVITASRVGASDVYVLNDEHLAAAAIRALAGMRGALIDRIRRAVGDWKRTPVNVSLFGSAARGDGDAQSDIDLLVVRPDSVVPDDETWRRQIDDLSSQILRWTGNHAGVLELSERELRAAGRRDGHRPLDELRRDGIDIAGGSLRQILRNPR